MAYHPPSQKLAHLMKRLETSISSRELQSLLDDYFTPKRNIVEIHNYRLAKGRGYLKELRSEIVPVAHFLKATQVDGEVHFSLSNEVPDCWLQLDNGERRGLEITRAHAKESFWLAGELNKTGHIIGHGGLYSNATEAEFRRAYDNESDSHESAPLLKWLADGILERMQAKNHPKYQGFELLIEARMGLELLARDRFQEIVPELAEYAKDMPFSRVHVIGNEPQDTVYLRLK